MTGKGGVARQNGMMCGRRGWRQRQARVWCAGVQQGVESREEEGSQQIADRKAAAGGGVFEMWE